MAGVLLAVALAVLVPLLFLSLVELVAGPVARGPVTMVVALLLAALVVDLTLASSSSPKAGTTEAPSPKTCVPASPPSTKT